MTRVLLITPYGFQNQGIRLLAAKLNQEGFEAPVLFLKRWINNNVCPPTIKELSLFDQFVMEQKPDLIGIGFGTPYLQTIQKLTKRIRKVTEAKVLWGGVHPTIVPEDGQGYADWVCVGEGEHPITDLASAIKGNRSTDQIENIWPALEGPLTPRPLRPLLQNLDSLPYDRLLDLEAYIIEDDRLVKRDPLTDNAFYRVFASRGCPFKCAFCYNNQFRETFSGLGKYHRIRSVDRVINELEIAKRSLSRLRRIKFDDDSFVFPPDWLTEFCERYRKQIGLPFDILMNPEVYREKNLRQLKTAGLFSMQVGVQSASADEIEQSYDRKDSCHQVLELAATAKELGLEIFYDIILDNPLATDKDKRAMFEFLMKLPRPFNLYLYSLTIFPRSDIAKTLLAKGLITEDDIEGKATKSLRQFRLSLDYPRPARETYWASLISLTSKSFVPKSLIRRIEQSDFFANNPGLLRLLAELTNFIKLFHVGWSMWRRGELSGFKLKEYANLRRLLNL